MNEPIKESNCLDKSMYFSYGQFLVFDESVSLPGCAWTEAHTQQGFARRDSTVCVGTILEYGEAAIYVLDRYSRTTTSFERILAVPFFVTSGSVLVEGPEEQQTGRKIELVPGHYRLTVAQRVEADEE